MSALLFLSAADVERVLTPRLLAATKVVTDLTAQAAAIAAYRSYTLTARRAA